jgi:hypothetical protein
MVEAEQAYQLADVFSTFRVGSKRPMHTLLTVHNTSNKRRKGTVETARTCLLTRLPKCGQARAHGAQAVGQAIPVWQQTDILDICTRAIALASSMQDWRAAHGLTLPLGLYLVWSVIWDFKRAGLTCQMRASWRAVCGRKELFRLLPVKDITIDWHRAKIPLKRRRNRKMKWGG